MSNNAVATKPQPDPTTAMMQRMAPQFEAALPRHVPTEKFVRAALTAVNTNPDLRDADQRSLFGAIVKLAQDGLMPDNREAALVIFNKKSGSDWVKFVQPMPMISGLLKMMRQSGEVEWVDAHIVRERDKFQYRPGLDEAPIFEPNWFGDRGEPIGAYAIAKLKSGEIVPPEIMSLEDIEKVRNASRSAQRGPWVDWWEQMALKSVLRRFLKKLPMSTDRVMGIIDRDIEIANEPMRPISQIDVDAEADTTRSVSGLEKLEGKVAPPPSPPKPKGRTRKEKPPEPDTGADQVWVDKIDGCTSQDDLSVVRASYKANEYRSEVVEAAFVKAAEALS